METEKGKKSETFCLNLEFLRSQSISREAKVKEFWKFLDSQDVLKPFQPCQIYQEEKPDAVDPCAEYRSPTKISSSAKLSTKSKKTGKKEAKGKKHVNNSCQLEKYLREDLRYADTVEISYDEINAEIEEYQRRLLSCKLCEQGKCMCKKRSSN